MGYKFNNQEINELIGVTDSSLAPKKLMENLLNEQNRIKLFQRFLNVSNVLSEDWFGQYFESDNHDSLKQSFNGDDSRTEDILLTTSLDAISGITNEDYGAKTGSNTIVTWQDDLKQICPVQYEPEKFLYVCEEDSDKKIPFLLFNLSIRGMNAIVWHGNFWERECKGVFLVRNTQNSILAYSDIQLVPCSKESAKTFFVKKWINYKDYSKYATGSTYMLGQSNIDRMIFLEYVGKPGRHFSRYQNMLMANQA